MRRVLLSIVFLAGAALAVSPALACHITFEPGSEVEADASGKAKFTVVVEWEHRKCVLDEDDLTVDYSGVKKLSQSDWEKVRPGLFKAVFEVQLEGSEGSVRVWRECSKKGVSEASVRIVK